MIALSNRRVHARLESPGGRIREVVRYEKQGKWYVESVGTAPRLRWHVTVRDAARIAAAMGRHGGEVTYGIPGGKTFDARVRVLQ